MIKRMERVGDAMRIVVQGTERIKVVEWKQQDPYMRAVVQILPDPHVVDAEQVEAARRNLQEMIQQALSLLPNIPPEVRVAVLGSVDAVRLALARAGDRAKGSVAASDAFFPFADGLQALIDGGVRAVVQPGGSVRDAEVIEAAQAAGLTMYLTGTRHFLH